MLLKRWQSALGTVVIAGLLTCASAQAAPLDLVVLSNSFKPFPENVRVLDTADPAALIEFDVALKMRNYKGLRARIDRREVVPNAEMESTHLPLRFEHAVLVKWIEARGLSVKKAYDNRLSVRVVGTVAQVQAALGVEFAKVSVDGQEYIAAKTAPSIPQFLTGFVLGINGLQPYQKAFPLNLRRVQPLSPTSAFAAPYSVNDIKTAYQATGITTTGAGQRIAILIDTFPLDSDLTTFWSANNVSQSLSNIEKIQAVAGALPATNLETSLDAEWTSGIAPGAKIRIYASQSLAFTNIDTAFQRIISDLNAGTSINVLSISLGACESDVSVSQTTTDNQFLSTIASRGVTTFVSSGDSGSNGGCTSGTGVSFFASSPNVTAVGGTNLVLNGAGMVTSETGWTGSGGGNSTRFSRPSWQVGTGVPSGTTRLVPDVALDADLNTGFYVVFNGGVTQVGGTSASAPAWAGFTALINQGRLAAGKTNLGFLNPIVYPLLGTSSFRDITSGSNGLYSAAAGYDRVTGIGVPVLGTLYNNLIASVPAVTSFSPTSGSVGSTVNIAGSGFAATNAVRFNGTATPSFVINSNTSLTALVPSGATSGTISITTPAGSTTSATSFTVVVTPAPTITSFTPANAPIGTSVIITGNNFTGTTSVTINGVATTFVVNSNTQITATVPSGGTTGLISVTTLGGTATSGTTVLVPGDYSVVTEDASLLVQQAFYQYYSGYPAPFNLVGSPRNPNNRYLPIPANRDVTVNCFTGQSTCPAQP
jgi:kumamolisin